MRYTTEKFKNLSKKEFTKAAEKYDWDKAGVYKICRNDYPDILEEIKKEDFNDLLDAGCWTWPIIELLTKEFPDKHYVGLDLTPKMIEVAKKKKLKNAEFIVWDCEDLPFENNSFDIIVCSQSFHHYPNPQKFFNNVSRVLRPGGKLILRDMHLWKLLSYFANYIELPILNRLGYWDVKIYTKSDIQKLCDKAWLTLENFEHRLWLRLHAIIRKWEAKEYNWVKSAFKSSINVYDDLLTWSKWWSKFYINFFWQWLDDKYIAKKVLPNIPKNFKWKLLDVPVWTAVFTHELYKQLKDADITWLDYSDDMLAIAKERMWNYKNVKLIQWDVWALPFKDGEFDIVLSMNGFHCFPDKDKARSETHRVLKKWWKLVACFYIRWDDKRTNWLVDKVLSKKWFIPPYDTEESLKKRLNKMYDIENLSHEGSVVYFTAIKK